MNVQLGIVEIIIDRIKLQMVMRPEKNFYNLVLSTIIFVRYKLVKPATYQTNENNTIF